MPCPAAASSRSRSPPFYARDSTVRLNPELREGPYALLTVQGHGHGHDPGGRRAGSSSRSTRPRTSARARASACPWCARSCATTAAPSLIESEPGQGTLVKCFFPASAVASEEMPTTRRRRHRAARPRRADPLRRRPARDGRRRRAPAALARATSSPRSRTPTEALAALAADPAGWDLVVTDYSMPVDERPRTRPGRHRRPRRTCRS